MKTMRKRASKRRLQSIGEILLPALKKRGLAPTTEESALFKLWPKAVGEQIAAQTKPAAWREGTLFVKTTSSVWVQQLHFMKEDIRQKINDLSAKQTVKEIIFTVGHNPALQNTGQSATAPPKIALRERDKKMIAECTETLADRELADIVKRVMKMEISRRRLREAKQGR
jgi:predicted nucleic acid-binding Zn ribbon protein